MNTPFAFVGMPGPIEILIILVSSVFVFGPLVVGVLVLMHVLRSQRKLGAANPNLRPCPDCGQYVSRQAPSCPRCGRPLDQPPQ